MHPVRHLLPQLIQEGRWTPGIPLLKAGKQLPHTAGLYRIRLDRDEVWLYVGQTADLANRMGMLNAVFGREMPYAAPHTVGPALYAYRQIYPEATLLVSVCELDVPDQNRLALESFAIALHRQTYQRSPLCQFGRMPSGWRASSGNSAQLAARGKRFRGGPTDIPDESHLPDIAPPGTLDQGTSTSTTWFNLPWTSWMEPAAAIAECGGGKSKTAGLYRIQSKDTSNQLLFIGQGKIAQRLNQYKHESMLCSWSPGTWHPHQRLALVTDLIGSYLLQTGNIPPMQFQSKDSEKSGQPQQEPTSETLVRQLPLLLLALG